MGWECKYFFTYQYISVSILADYDNFVLEFPKQNDSILESVVDHGDILFPYALTYWLQYVEKLNVVTS